MGILFTTHNMVDMTYVKKKYELINNELQKLRQYADSLQTYGDTNVLMYSDIGIRQLTDKLVEEINYVYLELYNIFSDRYNDLASIYSAEYNEWLSYRKDLDGNLVNSNAGLLKGNNMVIK